MAAVKINWYTVCIAYIAVSQHKKGKGDLFFFLKVPLVQVEPEFKVQYFEVEMNMVCLSSLNVETR